MRSIISFTRKSGLGVSIWCFFCFTPAIVFSQISVRGKVTGRDGTPLGGATIQTNATTSLADSAGHFSITAKPGDLIEFSFVGYITHRVILRTDTQLNIRLKEVITELDSVVMIGYGTSRKKDLTGAVASVSKINFNKGIFASPDQLIQGKVSGVQISYDNGQPGGAATIKIRGNASLTGTGQPLYVIDGVLLDGRTLQAGINPLNGSSVQTGINPLNFINPDDIASIDVLKDASATAIYGSRAAFGVIIITSKKAQAGSPKLDVAISTGISTLAKKVKTLNAAQFREAIEYYNLSNATLLDKGGNVDAFEELTRQAIQQNYTVGVTGGNDAGKYRLSTNLLNQDGIILRTAFKKYSFDLATNFKLLDSKKIGLDINVKPSQYIQNVPVPEYGAVRLIVPALRWNPTTPLRNPDGSFNLNSGDNPIAITEMLNNNFKVTTILGSISPYYKFNDWLEYKLLFSINYSTGITRYSAKQGLQSDPGGTATISNSELKTKQITNTLHLTKKIAKDLHIDALAGLEYIESSMKGSSVTGIGPDSIGFGNYGLDYTNYIQFSQSNSRKISSFIDPATALQSFFGRAIFNYKDKYLLTATFRADGSTKFGKNNKYGYFPSFAAAWNITNEKIFPSEFFNKLKARAGWGKTGNQEFPSGASQPRYSFSDNGVLLQVNNPNVNLKWQSDRQYNIGLDFSVLDNRLSGTLDYFNKSTTDLLFPSPPVQPAPPSSIVRWINLDGKIINKGFEILLNGAIIRNENLSWDLSVNATFLKNNVADIPAPIFTGFVSGPVQIIQNGLPMQTFYTRRFLGLDKNSGLSTYEDGGATFYNVGNPNPKTLLGFSSTFQYNRFSMTANMYGAFGQDIYDVTLMAFINAGGIKSGNIGLSVFNEKIKESLANPVTPSSRFITKGSYFKMANLTISYAVGDIPKILKGANLYITAQNLFTLTGYTGFDPEVNGNASINNVPSLGIDYPHYPSSRTIIAGINFSL